MSQRSSARRVARTTPCRSPAFASRRPSCSRSTARRGTGRRPRDAAEAACPRPRDAALRRPGMTPTGPRWPTSTARSTSWPRSPSPTSAGRARRRRTRCGSGFGICCAARSRTRRRATRSYAGARRRARGVRLRLVRGRGGTGIVAEDEECARRAVEAQRQRPRAARTGEGAEGGLAARGAGAPGGRRSVAQADTSGTTPRKRSPRRAAPDRL